VEREEILLLIKEVMQNAALNEKLLSEQDDFNPPKISGAEDLRKPNQLFSGTGGGAGGGAGPGGGIKGRGKGKGSKGTSTGGGGPKGSPLDQNNHEKRKAKELDDLKKAKQEREAKKNKPAPTRPKVDPKKAEAEKAKAEKAKAKAAAEKAKAKAEAEKKAAAAKAAAAKAEAEKKAKAEAARKAAEAKAKAAEKKTAKAKKVNVNPGSVGAEHKTNDDDLNAIKIKDQKASISLPGKKEVTIEYNFLKGQKIIAQSLGLNPNQLDPNKKEFNKTTYNDVSNLHLALIRYNRIATPGKVKYTDNSLKDPRAILYFILSEVNSGNITNRKLEDAYNKFLKKQNSDPKKDFARIFSNKKVWIDAPSPKLIISFIKD